MPFLQFTSNVAGDAMIDLTKDVLTVGREPLNAICIDDVSISKFHALIVRDGKNYRLYDLHSSNGTWLGSERITTSVLRDGDEVRFGRIELRYQTAVPAPAAVPQIGLGGPRRPLGVAPRLQVQPSENTFVPETRPAPIEAIAAAAASHLTAPAVATAGPKPDAPMTSVPPPAPTPQKPRTVSIPSFPAKAVAQPAPAAAPIPPAEPPPKPRIGLVRDTAAPPPAPAAPADSSAPKPEVAPVAPKPVLKAGEPGASTGIRLRRE